MSNKISTMVKRLKLATRAFGAEPGQPEVAALAEWIADHRGRTADIITYQIHQSLAPQIPPGIMTPCAGGKFYKERILHSIANITDNKAIGELHVDTDAIVEDAAGIVVQKKGAWCAIPAPHHLGIDDAYYHNADEWNDAICGAYLTMMRAMRDNGVAGHVLIGDRMDEAELAALSRQKVFFFQPEPDREDLAILMEHQRQVAVGKDHVQTVFDLTNEYTLQKIFIIGPDRESINLALDYLDPDQIVAGGYCTEDCGEYWKTIVANAFYER